MKRQNFLLKVAIVLAGAAILFSIYKHYHEEYIKGLYLTHTSIYQSCLQAQARGDSLTQEEIKNCDSIHRLVIEYDNNH